MSEQTQTTQTQTPAKPIATTKEEPRLKIFRDWLDYIKPQLAMALPKHLTAERMIRMATTTLSRNPQLMECTPVSVCGGVIQAAELGLELAGPLGQAYLVPRRNKKAGNRWEANFQVGYRGLIQLAYRSAKVKTFNAHVVHENDFFDFAYGTESFLKHKPARGDRGQVTHVYSVMLTTDGGSDFEVMTAEDVEEHRKRYATTHGEYSAWETAWEEMAKKTPLRRLSKRVPVSIELVQAAILDEYAEHGIAQELGSTLSLPALPKDDAPPTGRESLRKSEENGAKPETPPTPSNGNQSGEPEEVMSQDQDAEIAEQMQRTGKGPDWLNDKVKEAGAKRYAKMTPDMANALLAELRAIPDKEERQPEATAAGPRKRFS